MDIQLSFKADSQLAKACKPVAHPLHHPPVLAQPLAALNASSGNPADDAPLPPVGSASLEVAAFVGVQLGWSFTGTPWQACNRRNRVHALLEYLGVMPVRTADQDHQMNAPLASRTMRRLEPSLPMSVWLGPASCLPPGAWYRGAINAGPALLDLVVLKVFPRDACLQHEQDAVEGSLVADRELARTAFDRRNEGGDQAL